VHMPAVCISVAEGKKLSAKWTERVRISGMNDWRSDR
jgi:hypothetical protein